MREIEVADVESMFQLNSDWDVMKYTGYISFGSLQQARVFIKKYPGYEKNGFERNAVILKGKGEFLGWCELKKLQDGTVDIGYRFLKRNWNKGYATESAKAMLGCGFRNYDITEVIGSAAEENISSVRVSEKPGMSFVCEKDYNGLKNAVSYTILKTTF